MTLLLTLYEGSCGPSCLSFVLGCYPASGAMRPPLEAPSAPEHYFPTLFSSPTPSDHSSMYPQTPRDPPILIPTSSPKDSSQLLVASLCSISVGFALLSPPYLASPWRTLLFTSLWTPSVFSFQERGIGRPSGTTSLQPLRWSIPPSQLSPHHDLSPTQPEPRLCVGSLSAPASHCLPFVPSISSTDSATQAMASSVPLPSPSLVQGASHMRPLLPPPLPALCQVSRC